MTTVGYRFTVSKIKVLVRYKYRYLYDAAIPWSYMQGCGSGSGLDPDPYWEFRSRGKKMKKFQWKNALFSYLKKKFHH
jgi:hypothetical protein